MPVNTPDIKVANVRRLGGLVELVGESYQEAQAYAQVTTTYELEPQLNLSLASTTQQQPAEPADVCSCVPLFTLAQTLDHSTNTHTAKINVASSVLQERAVRDGLTFVAPYDDPYTIAGQGTIGDEILRQVTQLLYQDCCVL